MIARENFQFAILDLLTWVKHSLGLDGICIPYVQDIESLKHQQGEQNDALPKADREDGSGKGRVEMTSLLVPGFIT